MSDVSPQRPPVPRQLELVAVAQLTRGVVTRHQRVIAQEPVATEAAHLIQRLVAGLRLARGGKLTSGGSVAHQCVCMCVCMCVYRVYRTHVHGRTLARGRSAKKAVSC